MFAKLDEFGILDVIVVDDYWNRKVLHGLEIEQRPGLVVCVAVSSQAGSSAALRSAARPMLHAPVQARHYLTYYVLRAHEHTSSGAQRDCVQTF